jgi:hypothetical protein
MVDVLSHQRGARIRKEWGAKILAAFRLHHCTHFDNSASLHRVQVGTPKDLWRCYFYSFASTGRRRSNPCIRRSFARSLFYGFDFYEPRSLVTTRSPCRLLSGLVVRLGKIQAISSSFLLRRPTGHTPCLTISLFNPQQGERDL